MIQECRLLSQCRELTPSLSALPPGWVLNIIFFETDMVGNVAVCVCVRVRN